MPFSKGLQWFTRWLKKPSRNIQDEVAEVFYRCDKCFAEIVVRDSKGVLLQSTISSLHYPLLYTGWPESLQLCRVCCQL